MQNQQNAAVKNAIRLQNKAAKQKALLKSQAAQKQIDDENRLRGLVDSMPGYQNALGGEEFGKLKGIAFGNEPIEAYKLLREQAQAGSEAEKARLGMALQEELQNQDVGLAGQQANAYSQLAQEGGLSGGARERIAASGLENALAGRQGARLANQKSLFDLGAKTQSDILGIGAQEAEKRLGLMGSVTDATVAEDKRRQEFELQKAKEKAQFEADQLKAASAERVAKANQKKDTWIVTAFSKRFGLDERFARNMYRLRIFTMEAFPQLSKFYHGECDELVKRMDEANFDYNKIKPVMIDVSELVKKRDYNKALDKYIEMTASLLKEFWPERLENLKGELSHV